MIFTYPLNARGPTRAAISEAYLADETKIIKSLAEEARLNEQARQYIQDLASSLVKNVREQGQKTGGIEAFLHEYDLSSQEGIVLMCLAEALLRIPDPATADNLIHDKLTQADWETHLGRSHSLFVNASTWGLMLTGRVIKFDAKQIQYFGTMLNKLFTGNKPVVRMALKQAMRIIAQQFVMGRTIDEALVRSRQKDNQSYRYSFDMLGEAALTRHDARSYLDAYSNAISVLAKQTGDRGETLIDRPSISVKLSALHPRYEFSQRDRVIKELVPIVSSLAEQSSAANIGLTIDAEEADRLELSLDIFEKVFGSPGLHDWEGFGLAVQAYQKRAVPVIRWLHELANRLGRRIPIRLVKGAYWDTEIKRAQERGLQDYPVFTRKIATDVSYLACAKVVLSSLDTFYPQFATHNAHTIAAILAMAGDKKNFEFQRLHGMGEALYSALYERHDINIPCRVYAPVGSHEDLLPYLVRRLLENGANTSFVNRIEDENTPVEEIIADPMEKITKLGFTRHPHIPLPLNIYGENRFNSFGVNIFDVGELEPLAAAMNTATKQQWTAAPLVNGKILHSEERDVVNPCDNNKVVGKVMEANAEICRETISVAANATSEWRAVMAHERAGCLLRAADLLEQHRAELVMLCIQEGGRCIADALAEVREAVDYCRYYAMLAGEQFEYPKLLPGPTGERNTLSLHGRGVFVCISPWNFPIAIFTGQITAALVAGNAVIAKPARQTPLTAMLITRLLHMAGIPKEVLHLLPGQGGVIGSHLISDERIAGVAFTGSTETAWSINKTLAGRKSPIVPFIAETGGQNVMIVDSSALLEQVVIDILQSAFNSAGQRCSALRVLYLQEDIAPQFINMLQGAMAELKIGDPALLETDIGPLIDQAARQTLEQHVQKMIPVGKLIFEAGTSAGLENGCFFAPRVYEIEGIEVLDKEVFGPILHIIKFDSSKIDKVIESINNTGYGLTLGIHSRIDKFVQTVSKGVRVGNIYVNRNMIGAVVGVQPFGGEGLSGTGPKAGGPHYLQRFAVEQTLSNNIAAIGGNANLILLKDDAT